MNDDETKPKYEKAPMGLTGKIILGLLAAGLIYALVGEFISGGGL